MMRRWLTVFGVLLIGLVLAPAALARQDRLVGRWEGKVQSAQGERDAAVNIKKEGDKYAGTVTGMRGNEIPFKEVTVDGNKVTALAEVETAQGKFTINFKFELQGEALKGEGEVDFGGNTFGFTYDLKRASAQAAAPAQGQARPEGEQARQQPRPIVPQPQQKQSLDYFAGQWAFRYVGRESPLGPAPREGTVTFTKSADGRTLAARTAGKSDAGAYQESAEITFDEATKMLTFAERLGNGLRLQSQGDWRSPISIRFTVAPVKVKGQTLQLRRTISVISAHSFEVVEELSEDGGPFVRLGKATYAKVGASAAKN